MPPSLVTWTLLIGLLLGLVLGYLGIPDVVDVYNLELLDLGEPCHPIPLDVLGGHP
jgi:hypothetical protein